jgi:hypothetical protein
VSQVAASAEVSDLQEHDDFNGQLVAVTPAQVQQLEDSDEGKLRETIGHPQVGDCPLAMCDQHRQTEYCSPVRGPVY